MKKGQQLRLFIGTALAAIANEKSTKISYQNEFEDSTTKDTPNGEQDEEFIRNKCTINCDFLVGEMADLKTLEDYYRKGEKCKFEIAETKEQGNNREKVEGDPFEQGYIVFDSFDIDASDRQNKTASFSAHKVAAPADSAEE